MLKPVLKVGLDISDYKLRIVTLSSYYNKLALQSFNEIELPAGIITNGKIIDEDQLVSKLKTLTKNLRSRYLKRPKIIAGLPEQRTFVTTIPVASRNIDTLTREAIKNIPYEENETYYEVEPTKKGNNAAIAAGRKEFIDQYVSILDKAHIRPIGLYPEPVAIAKALINNTSNKMKGIMIVDIGLARTSVIFYINSSISFTTSYPSIIEQQNINESHYTAALQQVVQYYNSHHLAQSPLEQIILCGSGSYISQIAELTAQITGFETILGNPFQALISKRINTKITHPLAYTTAIGLAMLQ
ncbi:MAG: pilus assembly protein PilM [bacterium]|nr:pilus assembly protein PilM [bacterium]